MSQAKRGPQCGEASHAPATRETLAREIALGINFRRALSRLERCCDCVHATPRHADRHRAPALEHQARTRRAEFPRRRRTVHTFPASADGSPRMLIDFRSVAAERSKCAHEIGFRLIATPRRNDSCARLQFHDPNCGRVRKLFPQSNARSAASTSWCPSSVLREALATLHHLRLERALP